MTFTQFQDKYTGVGVNTDGVSGFECQQLINQYLIDVLGIPNPIQTLPGSTAIAIFTAFSSNAQFTKVINTPEEVPLPGDIIYWEEDITQQTGPAGDTAIFITGDASEMLCFGQNYPTGSLPHQQTRSYAGCVGWLHPIINIPAQTELNTHGLDITNTASLQVALDTWFAVSQGQYVGVAQYNSEKQMVDDLQTQVSDLQSKHNEDQKEIVNLNSSLATLSSSNKDYATQALDAEKVTQEHIAYMDEIAKTAGIDDNNKTDAEIHDEIIREIITLQENQKAGSSTQASEVQNIWQNSLQRIVNWLLKHGFSAYLDQNKLHVVDSSGNIVDENTVADVIVSYLNDRFTRLDFLENLQAKTKTGLTSGLSFLQTVMNVFIGRE